MELAVSVVLDRDGMVMLTMENRPRRQDMRDLGDVAKR